MPLMLPERTVDSWVSAYLATRDRHIHLWAPTEQNPIAAFDLAAEVQETAGGLAKPKVFVLEHKGVEFGPPAVPSVRLRYNQHVRHLALDAALGGNVLYYLLPVPPWLAGVAPVPPPVPGAASHRTSRGGSGGFGNWAWGGGGSRGQRVSPRGGGGRNARMDCSGRADNADTDGCHTGDTWGERGRLCFEG